MPRAIAPLFVSLFVLACGSAAETTPKPASATASPERDAPPRQSFGERCVAQPSRSGDGMLVACDDKQFMFIVPGTDWTIDEPPQPAVLVAASSGALNLSVRLADETESDAGVRDHLTSVHRTIVELLGARGLEVGEARLDSAPNGHLVLSYDIHGETEDGLRIRMVNAWTSLRRSDRRYLDFHVSFAAPADDPKWSATPPTASLRELMIDLADHFVVTDGKGNLPPQ